MRGISQLYAMAFENTMAFACPRPQEKSVLPHRAAGRDNWGNGPVFQQVAQLAQSLGKVFNNVIHMLNAYGESDRVGQYARFGQLCLGELRMCG